MRTAKLLLAVSLLVAGMLTWAALPMAGAHSGAKPALIAAICCAVGGLLRLGIAGLGIRSTRPDKASARPDDGLLLSGPERLWRQAVDALVIVPWPQLMIVAVLGLEALHPRRPWHTAVLGVLLLGYLVVLHLAESGARLAVFRPQLPLIAAGLGLAALSVAAAALPSSASGSGSGWLAVLAAIAAIAAAALALPV
jgi:hypothetical protein